jgi:hypothetical protein
MSKETPARTTVTLSISEKAKQKLEKLRMQVRAAGVARSVASESAIVERLVLAASTDGVLVLFT